ncbi:auxin-responsive protein IAA5-like [Bidens hawaiensis]|uniref:auxin-responsive protein IAA5-like n=1 Tax=Bidens hawaiensis TaxID=980011 RepID=UPI00404925A6
MELHLGLSLSSSSSSASSCSHDLKKRKHDDDDDRVPLTLPLLVWNKKYDCDADDEVQSDSTFVQHRNEGGVIRWPPVKLCRRKVCPQKMGNGGSKSMYVKVHMEGMGIARKVDLNMHQSYQTLVHTLATMFGKCYEDVQLTYQDKDGDWLLAGDVPWGSFIKTIQRLRLVKK